MDTNGQLLSCAKKLLQTRSLRLRSCCVLVSWNLTACFDCNCVRQVSLCNVCIGMSALWTLSFHSGFTMCMPSSLSLGIQNQGFMDTTNILKHWEHHCVHFAWYCFQVASFNQLCTYSRKLSREKTFAVLWLFVNVFSMNIIFFTNPWKFSPSKVFAIQYRGR